MSPIIGIDLGSFYSRISVWNDGKIEVISDTLGNKNIDSCVSFTSAKRSVIFSFILKKLKKIAEEFTGQTIKDVVISVPNSFNMVERKGIREAGIVSGLNVLSLINDSIAAGLTCVYEKVLCSKNVLVFDLGGGSLSVGIMDIDIEGGETVIPQAIGGSKNLGGSNFNYSMVNHFVKQIKNQNGIDITGNAKAMNKLKSACEMAKRIVSFENKAEFFVDCNEVKDFKFIITREKFQKLNEDLFQRCEETVTKCLSDAKVTKDDIRYIVLVGGSTRIPHIQNRLKLYFNHDIVFKSINRDEAVAYGAAIQCAIMRGEDKAMKILALDRTPFSLGLEKNTPERSLSALLVSTDTLERGVMHVVIPKNSILPASRVVTAGCEKERKLYFPIYEGESRNSKENTFLGELVLDCTREAFNKINITFKTDSRGILTVTAVHQTTGLESRIVIGNPNQDEVTNMLQEVQNFTDSVARLEENAKHKNKCLERERICDTDLEIEDEIDDVIYWLEGDSDPGEYEEKMHQLCKYCESIL